VQSIKNSQSPRCQKPEKKEYKKTEKGLNGLEKSKPPETPSNAITLPGL